LRSSVHASPSTWIATKSAGSTSARTSASRSTAASTTTRSTCQARGRTCSATPTWRSAAGDLGEAGEAGELGKAGESGRDTQTMRIFMLRISTDAAPVL